MKNNLQKSTQTGIYFKDVVTNKVLTDICLKITGQSKFTVEFVNDEYSDLYLSKGYNRGRLAILHYNGKVHYISFSEKEIGGRNSSVQSVPTAYNMFYLNHNNAKSIFYYFLNEIGNAGTDYQMLIYRLMKTVGFTFLNDVAALGVSISAFSSIEDIMHTRRANTDRNQSNNSTYITKSSIRNYDIYGKTYGANKYETSMICYALSCLAAPYHLLTLYEICEGNLVELPKSSLKVISKMNNIKVIATDMSLEKRAFEENNSLRSPRYIFNLLDRLGNKRCTLCNCEIPELIQGAHVLPVATIKKLPAIALAERIHQATDGSNGIWLCENHHKMFDEGLLNIDLEGTVTFKQGIEAHHIAFMNEVTLVKQLPQTILTKEFTMYLDMRNKLVV